MVPSGAVPVLSLIYGNRRYPVTDGGVVIGSDRQVAALAVGDAAVAPTFAAVVHHHGDYYLKDLGSAHGVHYRGVRVDNKRIAEGDVFQIGDHELRFTYNADG
jgi:pSer/pThr/pTyr-binding forkhead associated (FHA) protein